MSGLCPQHKKQQRGYTLMEAMISTAISSILATAALPAYESYVARAQMTEAMLALGSLKTQVLESAYTGRGFDTERFKLPGATDMVSEITVLASEQCPQLGGFEARIALDKPRAAIAGKTLRFWFDGNNSWSCSTGSGVNGIDLEYLPASCRRASPTIDTNTCTLARAGEIDFSEPNDADDFDEEDIEVVYDDEEVEVLDDGLESDVEADDESEPEEDSESAEGNESDEDSESGEDNESDEDDGIMTICHKPGKKAEKTMTINANAWGGHSGHGDTMGACP